MTGFKAKSLTTPPANGTTLRVKKDEVDAINTLLLDLAKRMIDEGYEPIKFSELADIIIKLGLKNFSADKFMAEIRQPSN
ncbi:hypothetical protein [Acinetobacter gandensis]|uniref:hypothetical protein n=1 Tax=Acinetobacter gandensis TaxID=1443941 RepID=UPI003988A916